ncbi:hypothetical protein KJ966_31830 [bacterium]|nr:hypothetical protein [bacterium]
MQYLIPAFLALVVGIALWLIQRKRLALDYEIIESEEFRREDVQGKYFIVRLRNFGNSPVKEAGLEIRFPFGTIDSANFSDHSLVTDISKHQSTLCAVIPLLNPRETINVTITVLGDQTIPTPTVSLRAAGVTALPKASDFIPQSVVSYAVVIALAVSLAALISLWSSFRQAEISKSLTADQFVITQELTQSKYETDKKFEETKKRIEQQEKELQILEEQNRKGKPDREQIIFALLNRSGLSNLIPQLISTGEGVTYWKTGLYLLHSFLLDQQNTDKYFRAMQEIINVPEIAPSSYGFTVYLLAKMEQYRGNTKQAVEYFEMCKDKTPLMYDHLMSQDEAYDLHALRNYLKNDKKP